MFHLPDWPKHGRYRGGKGRPAPSAPRDTLPPLPSVIAPLATINPVGDPPYQILERVRAILADHVLTDDERRHFAYWFNRLTEQLHDRRVA